MSPRNLLTAPIVRVAFLLSLFAALVFLFFFPFFAVMLILVPLPGISDIVWAVASLPVKLLELELPKTDKVGYTVAIAAKFYAPIVFLVVFATIFCLARNRHDT